MSKSYSLFSYKKGDSLLHKCPAWCKLLFIPAINILFLCLPPFYSAILLLVQFIIVCCLKFTFREQLTDLKPVIYYAVLLITFELLGCVFSGETNFRLVFSWQNQKETVFLLIKLFVVLQSASLVFKTSTSLELREGISKIFFNNFVITNALSMFMNFLPMVAKIWDQSKKAWIARGGKKNLKMYLVLLPVLFSVGMKKAYNSARAMMIRK